jgi:glycosyltransferase involved in cell wall biosynthesis
MSSAGAAEQAAGVVVVIPALNESLRIAGTIAAARRIPDVVHVVVSDDGSDDDTARIAAESGAAVARHARRRGKAAAMSTGAAAVRAAGFTTAPLLFLDADLGATAANAGPLVEPVVAGVADMTVAVLPPAVGAGGHGFVMRLATAGIEQATGWHATAPLSGQRCISRELYDALQPLARGFGVETGLTIDALRSGARLLECPVELSHRVTGSGWRDQRHRARQYRDVWRALAARGIYRVR